MTVPRLNRDYNIYAASLQSAYSTEKRHITMIHTNLVTVLALNAVRHHLQIKMELWKEVSMSDE